MGEVKMRTIQPIQIKKIRPQEKKRARKGEYKKPERIKMPDKPTWEDLMGYYGL